MDTSQSGSQSRLFWEARVDLWTELADDARSFYARRTRLVIRLLKQFVQSGTVLDVGCGVGLLVSELLADGYEAYGCDLAHSMVQRARDRAPAGRMGATQRFHACSGSDLPFTGTFNAVTAVGVFPYVRDCAEFLDVLSQRLVPGGILVASCINRRSLYTLLLLLKHMARFRPRCQWGAVWRNLWNSGVWSGGYLDGPPGRQCHCAAEFDRLLVERGYSILARVDLYNLGAWTDAEPQRRGFLGRWLARRAGWTHLALARKEAGA